MDHILLIILYWLELYGLTLF